MGQLIDGVWHDTGTIRSQPVAASNAQKQSGVTGSRQTAAPGQPGKPALPPSAIVIIYTFRWPPWAHRTLLMRQLKG